MDAPGCDYAPCILLMMDLLLPFYSNSSLVHRLPCPLAYRFDFVKLNPLSPEFEGMFHAILIHLPKIWLLCGFLLLTTNGLRTLYLLLDHVIDPNRSPPTEDADQKTT